MRPVVEDEADAGLPALLQGDVGEPLLGRAVVPLRQVRVAVGVVGRRPGLHPVHAPPALEPAKVFHPLMPIFVDTGYDSEIPKFATERVN